MAVLGRTMTVVAAASLLSFSAPLAGQAFAQVAMCQGKAVTITGSGTINGTSGDDVIMGSAGADTINGQGGNDTICAGAGNDVIDGGGGNDAIDGGTGTNTISFASATTPVTVNLAAGTATGNGSDTFTNISNVTGGPDSDTIIGNSAANVLDGGGGSDVLNGNGGADTLIGGAGADTASFATATGAVTANLATGTATGGGVTDTLSGIENLLGGPGPDSLTGNASPNVIDGGPGNDTLVGGGGGDTVSFASSTTAVTASLASGTATGAGNDTFSGFNKLRGSTLGDTLTGDANANSIDGNSGNDTCSGGAGVDAFTSCEDVTALTDAAGATDTASWSVPAASRFYFQNLNPSNATTCALSWSAKGPGNVNVFSSSSVCGTNQGPFTAATAGLYTVTLTGTAAGTHHFKFLLPPTQTFAYTLGTTIATNTPVTGEGVLESIQSNDVYTFTATAGERIFYVGSAVASAGNFDAILTGPTGASIFDISPNASDGPVTLTAAGTYKLRVTPPPGSNSLTNYGFKITVVPAAQHFSYTINSVISNGVPAAGAGNLETYGSQDDYTFAGTAGQKVYLHAISDNTSDYGFATITPPGSTTPVFSGYIGSDGGIFTLPTTGSYLMTIGTRDNDTHTGSYSVQLKSATAGLQTFAYTVGKTISNGVPGSGAGNLEGPGAEDDYTFTGTAGQKLFYDWISDNTADYAKYTLYAPNGTQVISNYIATQATIPLTATGTYRLAIKTSDTAHFGTYSVRLLNVAPPQVFSYTIGNTISNGVPAAGAGNIEAPGSQDVYHFTGTAGQKVIYQHLSDSVNGYFYLTITGPGGQVVVSNSYIDSADGTQYTLPVTGTYTMTIAASSTDDRVGTYSIKLLNVPAPQVFSYTIGNTISNGVPAAGAGNIEAPGSQDVYHFTGTAGQKVIYQHLSDSVNGYFYLTITGPGGQVVVSNSYIDSADGTQYMLPVTGTYTMTIVSASGTPRVGTYSIKLVTVPAAQTFAYTVGNTISPGVPAAGAGSLEAVGSEDDYNFSATSGQVIHYHLISNNVGGYFDVSIFAPNGSTVFGPSYIDSANGATFTAPATGTYKMTITQTTAHKIGTYSIKLGLT